MPSDTADVQDVQEANDASQEAVSAARPLGPTGMKAMQGEDTQPEPPDSSPDVPANAPETSPTEQPDDGQITIHPHNKGPEYLPSPETEPQTIYPEHKPPVPPEGWRPGGPERGG